MNKNNLILILILISILTIGGIIRFHALSDYKVYPDSFQSLVVADNIRTQGSIVAPMGEYGLLYPPFFGWTRPGYPLLINTGVWFGLEPDTSARVIAYVAGVLAILIAFLYVNIALDSRKAGIIGASLLALSYNHSIWSGFMLTETLGVLSVLTVLLLVHYRLKQKLPIGHWYDLATGLLFALAILVRYEYLVLAVPLTYLYFRHTQNAWTRLATIATGATLPIALTYFLYAPFIVYTGAVKEQISGLFDSISTISFTGFIGFVTSDAPLALLFCIGIFVALTRARDRHHAIFTFLAITPLVYLYYHTNPDMQRYFVHLLPFILVPASLAGMMLYQYIGTLHPGWKYLAFTAVVALMLVQGTFAYQGLHSQDDNLWFTKGYEEQVAKVVQGELPKDSILITSFPEPFYLATHMSTQSIADIPPFLFLPEFLNQHTVVVIEDEGMRHIFPHFTNVLQNKAKEYMVKELSLTGTYRYAQIIAPITEPVRLYVTTYGTLQENISSTSTP